MNINENPSKKQWARFSVAPMMDWTDRHCRSFHRVLSRRAVLYTEMVTADAVLHGDRDKLLGFDEGQHPVVLQLGGSDPEKLRQASRIGADWGYDAINLNVGCPSDRVQEGRFGACLMKEPGLVAELFAAMAEVAQGVPVEVKHRLGVDDQDPEESLFGFVETVATAGCRTFIVHARKAWLQGLSPKENRDIPPLDYAIVRRLRALRPDLAIHLNGGLETLEQALQEADGLDGVMLGRAAYYTPALLLGVDPALGGDPAPVVDAFAALDAYEPYLAARLAEGVSLHAMTRHMLGLFHGRPGGRAWRRILTMEGVKKGAGLEVVRAARAVVDTEAARRSALA
jgi:tRNA-dihydrouridine synthase A